MEEILYSIYSSSMKVYEKPKITSDWILNGIQYRVNIGIFEVLSNTKLNLHIFFFYSRSVNNQHQIVIKLNHNKRSDFQSYRFERNSNRSYTSGAEFVK